MRRFWLVWVAGLTAALAGPASTALALDFDMNGWWRSRYYLFSHTPVDPSGGSNTTEFFDMRMTIYPTLSFSDKVKIKARLDFLDNVLWGQNENEPSILTGLSDATSEFDRDLKPVDDVQVERLYGEVHTPIGVLEAGRMGLHFGLGILANSGDVLEWGNLGTGPEAGDTIDQILFATDAAVPLGWDGEHWIVALAYDRPVEMDIWDQGNDVDQAYLATILTNGQVSPKRVVGSHEAGILAIYLHNSDNRANIVLTDLYFHLDIGGTDLGPIGPFFIEGEGVVGTGTSRRGGILPENKKPDFVANIEEGLAKELPPKLAHDIALYGTKIGLIQQLIAEGLVEEGFSEDIAMKIASEGAGAGFDQARQEELDALLGGGVIRGGFRASGAKVTLEMGYASGGGDEEALPNFVGPQASHDQDANAATEDAFNDSLKSVIQGKKVGAFPFDTEWDPALILYDEVGPLDPVSFEPTVMNTLYLKGAFEYDLDDLSRGYFSVLWGQLNNPVQTFRVTGDDPNPHVIEWTGMERDLGVELDAGIYRTFYDYFRAELKGGYLFTGKAFGPEAKDIAALRLQIAIMF